MDMGGIRVGVRVRMRVMAGIRIGMRVMAGIRVGIRAITVWLKDTDVPYRG